MNSRDRVVVPGDSEFPARLFEDSTRPDRLYVRCGQQLPAMPRSVAIVGARAASGHAMATARSLAMKWSEEGACIVSGGAIGIDSAAHRGALAAGGTTFAILACGLDAPYPVRNRPLFSDIVASGGALLSAYPNGAPPRNFHFIHRNRLIASLVDAVIVVAAEPMSGSLHTARFARDAGKVVGAVPGTPGCEQLIASGAAMISEPNDLELALSGRPRIPDVVLPEAGSEEQVVFELLGVSPVAEETLLAKTGFGSRRVKRALTGLELCGLATELPGRQFIRSALAAAVA